MGSVFDELDGCAIRDSNPIPFQLRNDNFRFLRVRANQKRASDTSWQTTSNFSHDDERLSKHLKRGGNYGVMPVDSGVCILDVDNYNRLEHLGIIDLFLDTLAIKTGSDKQGYHFYFRCDGLSEGKKLVLYDKTLTEPDLNGKEVPMHLGEIYPAGCKAYVVGAGSIHPDTGEKYRVTNEMSIQTIDISDLDEFLFSKVKSRRKSIPKKIVEVKNRIPVGRYTSEMLTKQLGLRIEQFAQPVNGVDTGNGEIQGAHPIHGSSTGMNFSINPSKNLWHCFRCDSGGDPLSFIAIAEGFARCEDFTDGCRLPISGELFMQIKDTLRDKYGFGRAIDRLDKEYREENEDIKEVSEADLVASRRGDSPLTPRYTCNLPADNFIQQYAEIVGRTTDAYAEYHYAGALSILSILSNRRAVVKMLQGSIYPNLWIFCLGASSISRKSTAMRKANEFVKELCIDSQLPSSFSPEALIEELADNPRAWLIKDECGSLLASMRKSYMEDTRDFFCEIYENQDYKRRLRRGQRKQKNEFHIQKPFITQLYATTGDNFRAYTTTLDLTSGWLLRFMYFYPMYWKESKPYEPFDDDLNHELQGLSRRIENLFMAFRGTEEDNCIEFVLTDDALKYFQKWQCANEENLIESGDSIAQAMFGRLVTYAIKLAMIFKIGSTEFAAKMRLSSNKIRPDMTMLIELPYVMEACRQIEEYFAPTAVVVTGDVARNEENNVQNKILGVVRRAGGKCPRTHVLQALHIRVKDAEDAFGALEESGELEQLDVINEETGRAIRFIVLTKS